MTEVIRVEKNNNFVIMSKEFLKDKNLSLKTKGLMAIMLSLPDDWNFTEKGLANITNSGRDLIRTSLQELEENGYLIRNQERECGKFKDTTYILYEVSPLLEKPISENPTQLSNNIYNNNNILSSTKKSSKPKKKKVASITNKNQETINEIIIYLNKKCNKNFREDSTSNSKLINALLEDGYSLDDLKKVVDIKHSHWYNDDNMSNYLRPSTLFRKSNFENYINEKMKVITIFNNTNKVSNTNSDTYYKEL